jgi:hypothetical protein
LIDAFLDYARSEARALIARHRAGVLAQLGMHEFHFRCPSLPLVCIAGIGRMLVSCLSLSADDTE